MAEKVELNRVLKALDAKDRGFYDRLTDEEKKGFSMFLMLRYASSVHGPLELQHYCLAATNHYANRDFFNLGKHPKLQWLCLTATSPDMGSQRHQWIGMKKKASTSKKGAEKRKILSEMYPTYKEEDIGLLASITTDDEIKEYLRSLGTEA